MSKFDVDWAPCINLGHEKINVSTLQAASDRAAQTEMRRRRMEEATQSSSVVTDHVSGEDTGPKFADKGTQTDEVSYECREVQTCNPQLCDASVQTEPCNFFEEKNFLSHDEKVRYYTGLPTCMLLLQTFEFIMKPFSHGEKRSYYWRSLLIVLLKLRLNLGLQDIAYRLDISVATVSRLFHETLEVMVARLEWLIKWPERNELWKTMPNCFRACYGTKVVAIDKNGNTITSNSQICHLVTI